LEVEQVKVWRRLELVDALATRMFMQDHTYLVDQLTAAKSNTLFLSSPTVTLIFVFFWGDRGCVGSGQDRKWMGLNKRKKKFSVLSRVSLDRDLL
jgi:hypothetical protein